MRRVCFEKTEKNTDLFERTVWANRTEDWEGRFQKEAEKVLLKMRVGYAYPYQSKKELPSKI